MNPKMVDDLYIRELDDEKVVYDRENGRVHFMNQTATFILDLCDGKHSREEIIEGLLDSFDVERKQAEEDVDSTLKDMADKQILRFQ